MITIRYRISKSERLTSFFYSLIVALALARGAWAQSPATVSSARSLSPEQRAHVDFAMRNDGDPARGRVLFESERRSACSKCHSVDGTSSKAGPDLASVGDKFPRRELIRAVMEPSVAIAVGYGTTIIEAKSGDEYLGVVKDSSDTWVELKGADGKVMRLAKGDIQSQRASHVSLMPEGLEAGLSHPEFADLIAYLESLRRPESAFAYSQGMPSTIPRAAVSVELVPLFNPNIRLERPLWFGEVRGFTNRFVVLEHGGRSWIIERDNEGDTQSPLVDLSGTVRVGGATGLLGLALHPDFHENRKYYLKYQVNEQGRISTLVVERSFDAEFKRDSGGAARQLLKIPAVTQDHNGGPLLFGPDGFLYIGTGDTGPQRDPQGHGQDLQLLLGKILRIDVNRREGELPYAIPADNPFLGRTNARPEIWAYGFREPWRFSFDRGTGDFWVGDVGQDNIEEVSIVRVGENHGWNVYEGFAPFSNRYRRDNENYIPPVYAYSHRVGVSVTGGYVYRGQRPAHMQGSYICGDFESRRIWALTQSNRVLTGIVEIGRAPTRIASFSEDHSGELYLVGYDLGLVYRMNFASIDTSPLETRIIASTAEHEAVTWSYSLNAAPDGWFNPGFDDASWTKAPGGFGTRGTPGAVVRTEWRTRDIWLRREFDLPAGQVLPESTTLALRLHHDEDAEIFLNGHEAARLSRWTSGYTEVPINREAASSLRTGRNVIAIHCRQNSGGQYIDAGLVQLVRSRSNRASQAAK